MPSPFPSTVKYTSFKIACLLFFLLLHTGLELRRSHACQAGLTGMVYSMMTSGISLFYEIETFFLTQYTSVTGFVPFESFF